MTECTIGLIACGSRKVRTLSPAGDLYTSPLFTLSKAYCADRVDKWFVLSARHGLVNPSTPLAPYDETLKTADWTKRKRWASLVAAKLSEEASGGQRVLLLAGEDYRRFLLPHLVSLGLNVEVPLKGLSIGRQLQFLSRNISVRARDLDRLYRSLEQLKAGQVESSPLSSASGREGWPKRGVYFFFEPGEVRKMNPSVQRVVRVGTHAVSVGSKSTLWGRLRTHRGTIAGGGSHRSSIFRLHVGAALLQVEGGPDSLPTWGRGQNAPAKIRESEKSHEERVSEYIGRMAVNWLAIADNPDANSDRAFVERNVIALLAGTQPIDIASSKWMGGASPVPEIARSGLWNVAYTSASSYDPRVLDVIEHYVEMTLRGESFVGSLAPRDWRSVTAPSQLRIFEDATDDYNQD